MRIISGIYGRRRFDVPSSFSARPTTDFAKENIFNVVNNLVDLEGMDALDLFAGTGSISFELISRGCRNVTAIEKNNAHASFIAKVAKELKTDALALIRGDVFRYLNSAPKQSFDFIFADPPYALPELPEIPALVFERDLLRDGGIFIMEHPKTNDFSSLPTEGLNQALQTAALGGVDVRLMLPKRSDTRSANMASHSFIDEMVKAGVKVYLHVPQEVPLSYRSAIFMPPINPTLPSITIILRWFR